MILMTCFNNLRNKEEDNLITKAEIGFVASWKSMELLIWGTMDMILLGVTTKRIWRISKSDFMELCVNVDWRICYPKAREKHLNSYVSDYCPIFLSLYMDMNSYPKPFSFMDIQVKD